MLENGEERANLVTLVDDDGNEHNFVVVDIFPVNLKQYAILVPVDYDAENGDEEELSMADDAYIFRIDVNGESGEETLVEVDDEEEWSAVASEWENRMQDIEVEDEGEAF